MFRERLKELTSVIYNCVCTNSLNEIDHKGALQYAHELLLSVTKKRGKVYIIGNGGCAAIASHLAVDLINTLKIPATTLCDSNLLTCMSNEHGYENVFSKPLDRLMTENDFLVAISCSGSSANILNAVKTAKEKGAKTLTLSGFKATNPLRYMGDLNLWIESEDFGIVESAHFFLLHTIIDLWGESGIDSVADNTSSPAYA